MIHCLAYAKKPVGVVMMRPILNRLRADPRFCLHGTARLFGRRNAGRVFAESGVRDIHLVPKWLSRLRAFDVYLSADFGIAAPRARLKVHVFHGVSFRNHAVHENALKYDLLLLAGPYMRRRFESLGLLTPENEHRFRMVGMPKLDDLVNGTWQRDEVLGRLALDPSLPTILYAPTWAASLSSLERHGMSLIDALLSTGHNVIVKLHDNSLDPRKAGADWRAQLAAVRDLHFRFVMDPDVVPLMAAADVLVTDASSVANEFTLLDRPILFLDIDDLASKLKSKADLDTWGRKAGDVVADPRDLPAAIARALADPGRHSETRRALAADLFFSPGTATDRAIEAITSGVAAEASA